MLIELQILSTEYVLDIYQVDTTLIFLSTEYVLDINQVDRFWRIINTNMSWILSGLIRNSFRCLEIDVDRQKDERELNQLLEVFDLSRDCKNLTRKEMAVSLRLARCFAR